MPSGHDFFAWRIYIVLASVCRCNSAFQTSRCLELYSPSVCTLDWACDMPSTHKNNTGLTLSIVCEIDMQFVNEKLFCEGVFLM